MGEMIREIIMQAENEKNFELIRSVKEILDEFYITHNCPPDWRYIGLELSKEYPLDSWVFQNLELYNFMD